MYARPPLIVAGWQGKQASKQPGEQANQQAAFHDSHYFFPETKNTSPWTCSPIHSPGSSLRTQNASVKFADC